MRKVQGTRSARARACGKINSLRAFDLREHELAISHGWALPLCALRDDDEPRKKRVINNSYAAIFRAFRYGYGRKYARRLVGVLRRSDDKGVVRVYMVLL